LLLPALRRAVATVDPELPIFDVQTMATRMDLSLVPRRVPMLLASAFGVVALFLAAIGVYGVLAHQVTQRRRELGIRIALGSSPREVFRIVLRDGSRITAAGIVLGLAATLVIARVIAGMLYQVQPTDPLVISAVALLLVAVALVAILIPARRAASVSPLVVLNE
jgi:putative ABC transport system permease protein